MFHAAIVGLLASATLAQEPESIRLTAKPNVIVADGASVSTITAEVRDRSGRLMNEGVTVSFSTTLGVIEVAKDVQSGQASVSLTSSTVPGTATVTASAGHATAQIIVSFARDVVEAEPGPRSFTVRADYLLYNDYERVIDAVGNVIIRVGGLKMEAPRAQIDGPKSVIVAAGPPGEAGVVLSRGEVVVRADRANYQWDAQVGFLTGLEEPYRGLFTFHGSRLEPVRITGPLGEQTFLLRELEPGPLSIMASRIVYIPGEEIQFNGAKVMLNGKRRLALPIHVMPLGPSRVGQAQYLGVGPRGPLLDLPYYVLAGTNGSSQFRLKYNAPEGLYGATIPGWALDLIGKYGVASSTGGQVELTRLTSPDRGFTWTHNQNLSPSTRAYLSLDTRSGYGFGSRYSMGNTTMWHQGKGYSLSLTGAASHIEHTNANVVMSLQVRPRKLPGGFSWNTGLQLGQRWMAAPVRVGEEQTVSRSTTSTQAANVRVSTPTLPALGFRLGASVGPGITFTDGRARQSLLGTVTASRQLTGLGSLNLTYTYHDYGQSARGARTIGAERQNVTASLNLARARAWNLSAYSTFGLEHDSINARLSATYRFSDAWNSGFSAGYFRQILSMRDLTDPDVVRRQAFGATNMEVRLTRVLGERALSLVYDTWRNRVYLDYVPGAYW